MSLVRAAWERRPEGPAYLFPSVMLLYLAGQCAFLCTHLSPLDPRNSEGFSRVPMDSGPESSGCHQLRERSHGPGGSILENVFFSAISNPAAAQVKNFYVFGCGWWYDREIVLLPPLFEYRGERETMRETTRQLCLRAAQQQAGASPVTAVTIGSGSSGSAALVG